MAASSLRLSNNGLALLGASVSDSATSITVATGEGDKFPALTAGQYFMATLVKSSGTFEIVRVTARSGDVLTVTRAQEGTIASAFATNDRIEHRLTAGTVMGELARVDDDIATKVGKAGGDTIAGALTIEGELRNTGTGAMRVAAGTTAERPEGEEALLRFNKTTKEFEGHNGLDWASVGGSAISNDTSTATDVYPLFADATTGTAANVYTSDAKLLYKPSTGEFKSQQLVATNGIVVNSATVSASYTIPTGSHAQSAGPITVSDGITVTISDGSNWVVN